MDKLTICKSAAEIGFDVNIISGFGISFKKPEIIHKKNE